MNVNNNSLFVTLGGLDFWPLGDFNWDSQDPFPRGIAIFNMNSLQWVDSYDALADGYVTNQRIRSWYAEG